MQKKSNRTAKEDKNIQYIAQHLRSISRKMLKFDKKDETLKFLTEMFMIKLNCDFVAISLKEKDQIILRHFSGEPGNMRKLFPFPVEKINPILLKKSLMSDNRELAEDSPLKIFFNQEGIDSWFTVPINDEEEFYGLCVMGYKKKTVLYEDVRTSFDELGNYIAITLNLIKKSEFKEKKITGMEWISQHLTNEESIKKLVEKVVTFSGKETKSNYAVIYLLDDSEEHLVFEPPSYGYLKKESVISLENGHLLENYLPHVEEVGYNHITVPLMINMKVIGVLHAEKKDDNIYSGYDLEILQMYANYFTAMFENAQLTNKEKEQKELLEMVLNAQQAFVRETIEERNFDGINTLLGELLSKTIILYDRFLNPISYYLSPSDNLSMKEIKVAGQQAKEIENLNKKIFQMKIAEDRNFQTFSIDGGGEVRGFLAVELEQDVQDNLIQLAISMVKNIYALQFIKQKIERDANEQVKSTFIQRLLVEKIEDMDTIIEYASLFQWDLYKPYRISVIALLRNEDEKEANLLIQKTRRIAILEMIEQIVYDYNRHVITSIVNDQLIVFTPVQSKKRKGYWEKLYQYIQKNGTIKGDDFDFVLGIGGKTTSPEDYYDSYQKADQTVNVLKNSDTSIYYAFFEDLGSYTVLNRVKETQETKTYIKNYLQKLYQLSDGHQVDLFQTLRVYLTNNGSIKETSEELYIHRSTLTYRLDKIKTILQLNIEEGEIRFNLMLAYKLYDLYDGSILLD